MQRLWRYIPIKVAVISLCSFQTMAASPQHRPGNSGLGEDLNPKYQIDLLQTLNMRLYTVNRRLLELKRDEKKDAQTVLQAVLNALATKNNIENLARNFDRYRIFLVNVHH